MATRHRDANAPDRTHILAAADELARQGLRVLAVAMTEADDSPFDPDHLGNTLTSTGLQAMLDLPRPAAIAAVESCRTAGIAVKVIAGDHATTAAANAARLGILTGDDDRDVLTGVDLAKLDAVSYPIAVERAAVFARVSPEQEPFFG